MTPSPFLLLAVALFWTVPATLAALFYSHADDSFSLGRSRQAEKTPMETANVDVLLDVSQEATSRGWAETAALQGAERTAGPTGEFQPRRDRPVSGPARSEVPSWGLAHTPVRWAEATVTVSGSSGPERRRCSVCLN